MKFDLTLPRFDCKGCGKCCTLASWTKAEDRLIRKFLLRHGLKYEQFEVNAKKIEAHDIICPYLTPKTNECKIYPVRPLICRLYGHTKGLNCLSDVVPERWSDFDAVTKSINYDISKAVYGNHYIMGTTLNRAAFLAHTSKQFLNRFRAAMQSDGSPTPPP